MRNVRIGGGDFYRVYPKCNSVMELELPHLFP
jgi:hypothetical protein